MDKQNELLREINKTLGQLAGLLGRIGSTLEASEEASTKGSERTTGERIAEQLFGWEDSLAYVECDRAPTISFDLSRTETNRLRARIAGAIDKAIADERSECVTVAATVDDGHTCKTGHPIFVFESQNVGYKVVAATGYHQGERDSAYVTLRDGLRQDEARNLAYDLRVRLGK